MDVNGKRILVTGAGGFIGSHLCDELVRQGARVTAFVRYNSRGDVGMLEADVDSIISGDVADPSFLYTLTGFDIVFHLAALIGIPYSYQSPLDYIRVNVEGAANLLLSLQHSDTVRVVHVSSSEVYGTAQYQPMDERHPLSAQSPYAATKIAADQLALSYHRSLGLPVTIVRPFNTYGPRQSTRAIVPTIITQALTGGPIELGRLSTVRDMTYVSDTVNGLINIGLHEDTVGGTVNLGSGKVCSPTIGQIAAAVANMVPGPIGTTVGHAERMRPKGSEVDVLVSDNSRAKALGWSPQVGLRDGLERTLDWYREHGGRFREGYAV
jgi:dTDP-glucose 4,6-dehydratase